MNRLIFLSVLSVLRATHAHGSSEFEHLHKCNALRNRCHSGCSAKMLKSSLIFLVVFVGASLSLKSWELPPSNLIQLVQNELDYDWMIFKKTYNKTYVDANEEIRRRLYWEDTVKFIREHNLKYDRGEVTSELGENDFADMAEDEFEKIYLSGIILPEAEEDYQETSTELDPETPQEIDWRSRGLVSRVRNQGPCGSSWAFSAVGALEGQWKKIHGGDLKVLSEQNLIDCAIRDYGNYGCRGGWMENAFRYIKLNKGINSALCYPYRGRVQSCKYKPSCAAASDIGVKKVCKSEVALQNKLASVGPISIAMDVNNREFWFYKRGIYYSLRCDRSTPNHAMLAVGYGGSGNRQYWIIKNSWGARWGKRGYVLSAKGKGDPCGISSLASYPIVA